MNRISWIGLLTLLYFTNSVLPADAKEKKGTPTKVSEIEECDLIGSNMALKDVWLLTIAST